MINTKRGLIRTVILIIIALIVLGYFGFNLEDILKSENVQKNLHYAWDLAKNVWNNYLAAPVIFLWDKFIDLMKFLLSKI